MKHLSYRFRLVCPNISCSSRELEAPPPSGVAETDSKASESSVGRSPDSQPIKRKGVFFRKRNSKPIQRFLCKICNRSFSTATLSSCYRQKKRYLNQPIWRLFVSGVSHRRISRLLNVTQNTVARKLVFLAGVAEDKHDQFLTSLEAAPLKAIQFDEMETFEKSKCLPLSISLVVAEKSRKILGLRVASMPAKGPLAEFSRKKYGYRPDHRRREASDLFKSLHKVIHPNAQITSDENPKYPKWISSHFSTITHATVKGRRGCITGQGELKKIGFDPLFDLNHTCAMIRANVNRMFRRTWCTTKRPDRLLAHLYLYMQYHNEVLTRSVVAEAT